MTRICWWLVNILSRTLEPDERDAVRGDFAESGETGGRALRDLLGLVVRRQVGLWKDWRPWLALLGLVGVAAVPLSKIAFSINGALGEQLRAYSHYGVRFETGLTLSEDIFSLAILCLALLLWSWTNGFVLGALSGRAIWLTGALFYLGVVDFFPARLLLSGHIKFGKPLLPLILLNAALPHGISDVLFLVAVIWGVTQGLRLRTLGFSKAMMLAGSVAMLTTLVIWTDGWHETAHEVWSGGVWRGIPWQTRLPPLALLGWPVGYMLVTASLRRGRGKAGFMESNT
jgi:hypothetical protein